MAASRYIQLQVKDEKGGGAQFRIKKSTTMRKLMGVYCHRFVPPGLHVRFLVQGVVIAPEDTADKLCLKEGDLIIALLEEDKAVSYGDSGDEAAEQPAEQAEPTEATTGAWPAADAAVASWTRARALEVDGTARERSEWLQSLDSEF